VNGPLDIQARPGQEPHHDGTVTVVFDGELYGEAPGSDPALVVVGRYAREGLAALAGLRGEFAFVLHDARAGRLLAVRDRFGSRPLHYRADGNLVRVTSSAAALLTAGAPRRWNLGYVADHLRVGPGPQDTVFDGVRQVPPGCALIADSAGQRIHRYWDLDYPLDEGALPAGSSDDLVGAYGAAVEDAVRVRVMPDEPGLGFDLSGGLDSAGIVAVAAGHARPRTFTMQFEAAPFDESAVAGRTAAHLGVANRAIRYRGTDLLQHLADTVHAAESVLENAHGVARLLYCAELRQAAVTVLISGSGSDETLGGLSHFHDDLTRPATTVAADAPAYLHELRQALGVIPRWVALRHQHVAGPLTALLRPDFAAYLTSRAMVGNLPADVAGQTAGRHPLHRSQYLYAKTWLANYVLHMGRSAAAHGMQVRLPFLDHRLFAVVRDLPPDLCLRGGWTKYPLRAYLRERLPREVVLGETRGLLAPPSAVTADALRELLPDGALRDNPFFEPSAVRRFVDHHAARRARRSLQADRLALIVISTCLLGHMFDLTAA
jgi:asparagine synthase (glutamine-hydrolysing)